MTRASDPVGRTPRPAGVPFWAFALSVIGLGALIVVAWREFPRVAFWQHAPPPAAHAAAGDVRLDAPHAARVARLSNLPQYMVEFSTSVSFPPGRAALTTPSRELLDRIVSKGDTLPEYFIEVAAFADRDGGSGINTRLRAERADSVIAYLTQTRQIPMARLVNATGLDQTRATDALPAPRGGPHAKDRRVDVKVVVSRDVPARHVR